MNKLIFNSIHEALDYSRRHFGGQNVIKDLNTEKIIAGSIKRSALANPVLFVMFNNIEKKPKDIVKIHKSKFTKTLTGFDQL